jgi:hypothetical protein
MSRALFLGDSHTCGYVTIPGKYGPGTWSVWNDNNYCDVYSEQNNKPVTIYSMAGVNNKVYTDWLKNMFEKYDDIDEVFLCMASFNRLSIAFDIEMQDEVVPIDYFTCFDKDSSTDLIHRYCDNIMVGDRAQLFNKPLYEDYANFPGFDFSHEKGLVKPDLRKNSYMQVKLFCEFNTFLEKRDFLNSVYTWDNICADHGAKLYLFNFTERLKFPSNFEYYGKLKATTVASKTVEGYFANKMIDHTNYYIADKEHYNREYHTLVATKFLPWLKSQ